MTIETPDTDHPVNTMRDHLRDEADAWAAAKMKETTDLPVPVVKRASRAKPKPAAVVAPVSSEKQPFKMSYDGTTDRDYIARRLALGAR